MAKSGWLHRFFTGSLFFVFWIFCVASVRGDENSGVMVEFSTTQTTPGQLITITLDITYDNGVDMLFHPAQQPWGKIELLEYSQSVAVWQEGQWLLHYTMQVAAPMAGNYQFPSFTVNFYRDADSWQVKAVGEPLTVVSTLTQQDQQLQGFEPLPVLREVTDYLLWFIPVPFFLIFVGLWFSRGNQSRQSSQVFTSALQLAEQAEKTGYMDWEGLRQWLVTMTGSDPLGKLTTSEPLLHDYQKLRFDAHSDSKAFSLLCRRCQEYWS